MLKIIINNRNSNKITKYMNHCATHILPPNALKFDDPEILTEEEMDMVLNYFRQNNYNLKYGDLIEIKKVSGYRNVGILIFDGTKIIDLDYEEDDYGSLPKQFKILQKNQDGFIPPIFYWHNVNSIFCKNDENMWTGIDHNGFVWFDHQMYLDEILKNIKCDNEYTPNKYTCYTYFYSKEINETVHIVLDEVELDMKKKENIEIVKEYFFNMLNTSDQVLFSNISWSDDFPEKNVLYTICTLVEDKHQIEKKLVA